MGVRMPAGTTAKGPGLKMQRGLVFPRLLLALSFATCVHSTSDCAELYQKVGDMFSSSSATVLSDKDQQWIEQRGYALKDPKAVTVFSLKLRAPDSICEAGLEVLFFEDSECKGKFCRTVIKCGSPADPHRYSLTLRARKDIAAAAWTFDPQVFDHCQRQAIRVLTPQGTSLVVIGRDGFELGNPNSAPPLCGEGTTF